MRNIDFTRNSARSVAARAITTSLVNCPDVPARYREIERIVEVKVAALLKERLGALFG